MRPQNIAIVDGSLLQKVLQAVEDGIELRARAKEGYTDLSGAAKYLGVHRNTFARWVLAKLFTYFEIGGKKMFYYCDLDEDVRAFPGPYSKLNFTKPANRNSPRPLGVVKPRQQRNRNERMRGS